MIPIQKTQSTDNPDARKNKVQKYVALILVDGKNNELYPLTKDYSIALLPIGNKKMILYQFEALIKLGKQVVEKVYIAFNQMNKGVQTFIQKQFLPQHQDFPLQIKFIKLGLQKQSNYSSFQQSLKFVTSKTDFENLIYLPCDTISSIGLEKLIDVHQNKKSDCTMLLRSKKEAAENEKKQPQENQNQIDLVMVSNTGQVLALDMIEEFAYSGFKVHSSILQRSTRNSVKKVIDSRIYVFSRRVAKIACQLNSGDLTELKPDFIGALVKNQTNLRLLNLCSGNIDSSKANMKKKMVNSQLHQQSKTIAPLNIFTILAEPEQYIKRISSLKIYSDINTDSLTQGSKQKQVLVPTEFTTKKDENVNLSKMQSILGHHASIGDGYQIRRSVVDQSCQIGKNVKIFNSVIMRGVQIMDGCKINDCVIGPDVKIGENSIVKSCYFAKNSRLRDGQKRDSQFIIAQ